MYPYRVFISYSHKDRDRIEVLADTLERLGLTPLWDKHLVPGAGFSEIIQRFIINSHIFIPFFSESSQSRTWFHQEIGFAKALAKPIVPVTIGPDPLGFIQDVQVIRLRDDLSNASSEINSNYFSTFWDGIKHRTPLYECAKDNLQRAQLLAHYADCVWAISGCGTVRQMASLTTFHLPSLGSGDPVWQKYYPAKQDEISLFDALSEEREALRRHALKKGCRLIFDPAERLDSVYKGFGRDNLRHRLANLLSFLRDDPIENLVVSVNEEYGRKYSITLVGDWFSSEAVPSGGTRGLREALFTRDLPTIESQTNDFDSRMASLLKMRGWDEESSREHAIRYFEECLEAL